MRNTKSPKSLRVAVVGNFQVGKSTLINALTGGRRAQMGDGTKAITRKRREHRSPCKTIVFIDTPGIDAEETHDRTAEAGLSRCDAAIFVAKSTRALNESERRLGNLIARHSIPTILAINCWTDHAGADGDPEDANNAIAATIHHQLRIVGAKIAWFGRLNIEWAAAARRVLNEERQNQLVRRFGGDSNEAQRILSTRSRVGELERLLMPDPIEAFSRDSLEFSILSAKFVNRWR